jgi:hypothetical protein
VIPCPLCATSRHSALQQRLALFDHLVGGGEFLLDTFSGWHGARPAHPEYSAKPQEEGAVIAKSNVPPIANFIDGIFSVERSAMTAGFSVRGSPVVNI